MGSHLLNFFKDDLLPRLDKQTLINENYNGLMRACQHIHGQDVALSNVLIEYGIPVNAQMPFSGKTALLFAVQGKRLSIIEFLLEKWCRHQFTKRKLCKKLD